MASLPNGNTAKSTIKRGSSMPSFSNPSMESSPIPHSAFPSSALPELDGRNLHPPRASWQQGGTAHSEMHFNFPDGPVDNRKFAPTFFTAGMDSFGNTQFSNPSASVWDNKLAYISAASNRIIGNHQAGPGLMAAELDYMHSAHAHMNADVSLRKIMALPQLSPEMDKLFNRSSWSPLNVSATMDPPSEGMTIQGMNFAASHSLPNLSADAGFAERAARFSPFGNVSYTESHLDGGKCLSKAAAFSQIKASGHHTMPKLLAPSSPAGIQYDNSISVQERNRFSLKEPSSVRMEDMDIKSSFSPTMNMIGECNDGVQKQFCASINDSEESMGQEVSSSCEKNRTNDVALMQGFTESVGRKRKAGPQRPKNCGNLAEIPKEFDLDDSKLKCQQGDILEEDPKPQLEQSNSGNSGESVPKSVKESSKPPEAPKPDFIHVRARRGQATDSHSLAERVRREKISERMKFLQDLVPGCSKVTGKAVMLDEIINYVQSLQRQVEFLSMKLAAVNPRVEFNIDNLFGRERVPRAPPQPSVFGLESANIYPPPVHHPQQRHVPLPALGQCPPLDVQSFASDAALRRTISTPPSLDAYGDSVSQVSQAWDDELQSVVQRSLTPGKQTPLDLQGQLFSGQMKVEQ